MSMVNSAVNVVLRMPKQYEPDRLTKLAKSHGLTVKDYMAALVDFAEGLISHQQVKDSDYLLNHYYTPSTYKLFAEHGSLRLNGMSKKDALKNLKQRYPRCSKKQWDAVSRL